MPGRRLQRWLEVRLTGHNFARAALLLQAIRCVIRLSAPGASEAPGPLSKRSTQDTGALERSSIWRAPVAHRRSTVTSGALVSGTERPPGSKPRRHAHWLVDRSHPASTLVHLIATALEQSRVRVFQQPILVRTSNGGVERPRSWVKRARCAHMCSSAHRAPVGVARSLQRWLDGIRTHPRWSKTRNPSTFDQNDATKVTG